MTGRTFHQSSFHRMVSMLLVAVVVIGFMSCKTVAPQTGSQVSEYGADNDPFVLTFESYVDIAIPPGITKTEDWQSERIQKIIISKIKTQIKFTYGVFKDQEPFRDAKGVLAGHKEPKILKLSSEYIKTPTGLNGALESRLRVYYSYSDNAVFHKKLGASRTGPTPINFVLPRMPDKIYANSLPAAHKDLKCKTKNCCTDDTYYTEGDFWYFWDPKKEGCGLQDDDLVKISGTLNPRPKTILTFPCYNELFKTGENGRSKVNISVFMGVDHKLEDKDDYVWRSVNSFIEEATSKEMGFQKMPGGSDRLILLRKIIAPNNAEQLSPESEVLITVYAVDPAKKADLGLIKTALETTDVIIYDGHSGLGGTLSMESFQRLLGSKPQLPKDRYQIIFFNGCSTFSYYNENYFDLKASAADPSGAAKLDIITNAMGGDIFASPLHDASLVRDLIDPKKLPWQTILHNIVEVASDLSGLPQVNGDDKKSCR